MKLTTREQDKLQIVVAAEVARRRKNRGLKLNYPESIALITDEVMEGARDGKSVAELEAYGASILVEEDVMEGITSMVDAVRVEVTLIDGTKLITINNPIR